MPDPVGFCAALVLVSAALEDLEQACPYGKGVGCKEVPSMHTADILTPLCTGSSDSVFFPC